MATVARKARPRDWRNEAADGRRGDEAPSALDPAEVDPDTDTSGWTDQDWAAFDRRFRVDVQTFCLTEADPRALHAFVTDYNWDHGFENPSTIAMENPACEAATALMMLWRGGGGFHQRYASVEDAPRHHKEAHRFLRWLEDDLAADRFPRRIVSYDLEAELDLYSYEAQSADFKRRIPDALRRSIVVSEP